MIHINLMAHIKREKPRALIPLLISVCFLGLTFLLLPFFSHSEPDLRPLIMEEREVVISVIKRLESKIPELAAWSLVFENKLVNQTLPAYVKRKADELVLYANQHLFFSKGFFSADSISQENSLMQVLVILLPSFQREGGNVGVSL